MDILSQSKGKLIKFFRDMLGFLLIYVIANFLYNYFGEKDSKFVDYDALMSDLLVGYHYESRYHMNKHHLAKNFALVDKKIFGLKDYEIVARKLNAEGWSLVATYNDSYTYCLNPYNEIRIVNPQKRKYIGKNGETTQYSAKDLEKWFFILYSNSDGTNGCAQYKKAD